jgi:hypothetical protein
MWIVNFGACPGHYSNFGRILVRVRDNLQILVEFWCVSGTIFKFWSNFGACPGQFSNFDRILVRVRDNLQILVEFWFFGACPGHYSNFD